MVKKIFLTLDSIVVMILIIVGIGYSYYAANVKYMNNHKTVILSDIINLNIDDKTIVVNDLPYEKSFNVENLSDKDANFNILFKNINNEYEDDLYYELYENNKVAVSKTLAPKSNDEAYIKLNIDLKSAQKKEYTLKFIKNSKESKKFTADLAINSLTINTEIKTATNYILLNNSHIKQNENIYYYEDASFNNVSLNNELWKIVKINEDGSIKIVKDTNIDTDVVFNENSKAENANNYTTSQIKSTLQDYYNNNLKKYENMLVNDDYCNDVNVVNSESYKMSDKDKTINEYIPNLACEPSFKSYIGLLSYDEVKLTFVNSANYTNTWLITKAGVSNYTHDNYVWYLNNRGNLDYTRVENSTISLRPTITLKSTLNIKGNGSIEDPFVFME